MLKGDKDMVGMECNRRKADENCAKSEKESGKAWAQKGIRTHYFNFSVLYLDEQEQGFMESREGYK